MVAGAVMALSAMGASRAEFAANITMAQNSWADYANLHEGVFVENGLNKWVLVDANNKIVANHSTVANAVKDEIYTNVNNATTLRVYLFLKISVSKLSELKT